MKKFSQGKFVENKDKNFENSFSSFDGAKETFRFSTKRRYMFDSYFLEKYVLPRSKLVHKQNKHQSNTLMLLLNYQPIFESFLDFYQTLCHSLIFDVYLYLLVMDKKTAEKLEEIKDDIKEIEFDEMWHFLYKKRKIFVIKTFDRAKKEMIAWVTGNRLAKTFKKLYEKVKHIKNCIFYTDSWDVFSKVLPKERHVIGKQHTIAIEQDNSNIRNDLARFTRRTKVVSKSENMINLTLKIWQALHTFSLFSVLQASFLSVLQ